MSRKNKNQCIHIAFNLEEQDSYTQSVVILDTIITNKFQNALRVFSDEKEKEVIYSIIIPIVSNEELNSDLFTKLKELFKSTSSMKPHFTNYNTED